MSKTQPQVFVMGDIHGAYKALLQCFERSGFDIIKDRLIVLGDVCDGFNEVRSCIEALLQLRHCDYIIGNHDLWTLDWATKGIAEKIWLEQGGRNTIFSYGGSGMPQTHIDFLKNGHAWITWDHKLFVHGGIDPDKNIEEQSLDCLVWDRQLVDRAWAVSRQEPQAKFSKYDAIFVGHTTTEVYAKNIRTSGLPSEEAAAAGTKPLFLGNVVMLDTGAGWSGKLTIMDVNTYEYWQSDPTPQLYGHQGRP